jgi:alkanesulfonate monooxygenase SsuD/methylene tetrahydromethanopterin reductase-like flavin-dependent oxidoreductase (luciferase family)
MRDGIRWGVLLPTGMAQMGQGVDPRQLIDFAVRAEQLGYASVWANDTVLAPRIEALTVLAALAPMTGRVTLGTATLMPVLRRPVQAAQAIASLDVLSGGRLVVAVGAGYPGRLGKPLYELSEVPWPGRFARLDETVALWRQLWTEAGPSSFHGEVLHFAALPRATHPYRDGGPPIWLGGATPAATARTGRTYDGWLPYPPNSGDYASGWTAVRRAARQAGRDVAAMTPGLYVTVLIAEDLEHGRRALDTYAKATYGLPLSELEQVQLLVTGPLAEVRAQLEPYIAAGAQHIVCRIGALGLQAQVDQLEKISHLPSRPQQPSRGGS